MKVLFLTNIPSPYRVDFYNELGQYVDLTVVFEARRAEGINFNWNDDQTNHFNAVFLSDGDINENKVNFRIRKFIKKKKYDYIFATNYAYYTEMFALLYMQFHRIPYFLEVDGAIIKPESKLKYWLKKRLISKAGAFFSPSEGTDGFFVHYGINPQKITRYPFTSLMQKDIDNTLISHDEKMQLREKLNMTEPKVVISVGRFIECKGFDILLKAMNAIPEDIGVYFIGGEPTEEYIAIQKQYGLDNSHFVGFKTKDELNEYYRAADLFVLPTRGDVWGLVVNEAMAKGLPVITTDRCGAGLELVRDNGRIINTDDVVALADSINEILQDENLLEHMSERSLEIIQGYTIEKMAEAHHMFLNMMCENSDKQM